MLTLPYTTYLLNITCTLVATGVTLGRSVYRYIRVYEEDSVPPTWVTTNKWYRRPTHSRRAAGSTVATLETHVGVVPANALARKHKRIRASQWLSTNEVTRHPTYADGVYSLRRNPGSLQCTLLSESALENKDCWRKIRKKVVGKFRWRDQDVDSSRRRRSSSSSCCCWWEYWSLAASFVASGESQKSNIPEVGDSSRPGAGWQAL